MVFAGDALKKIPSDIYEDDDFIMAEWHIYASGPNHKKKKNKKPSSKYWGIIDGKDVGRENVNKVCKPPGKGKLLSYHLYYFLFQKRNSILGPKIISGKNR